MAVKERKNQEEKKKEIPLLCRPFVWASHFVLAPALVWGGIFLYTMKVWYALGGAVLFGSFCSFVFYGIDKVLAEKQCFRIPERTLHLWDFFWGWPGGWLGRKVFRHKTQKSSFRIFFFLSVLLNILVSGVLVWWFLYRKA